MNQLTHIDTNNRPTMVDVSDKEITERTASAEARVILGRTIAQLFDNGEIVTAKGPVFQTAIISGTAGAKKTPDLIPFCHPVGIDSCSIDIKLEEDVAVITCEAKVRARTGIEMEAITGATVAAITIYDMCKAVSHDITISSVRLLKKTGGKNDFLRSKP